MLPDNAHQPLRPEASGNRTEAAAVGEPGSAPAATIYPGSHPLSSIEAGTGPLSIIQTTQGLHQCRPLSSETDAPLRDASLRESAVRHSMTSQRCTPVPSHEVRPDSNVLGPFAHLSLACRPHGILSRQRSSER